jgi:hypothetical protein
MYAYCNGNPVMLCDPTGHEADPWQVVGWVLGFLAFVVENIAKIYGESNIEQGLTDNEKSFAQYFG